MHTQISRPKRETIPNLDAKHRSSGNSTPPKPLRKPLIHIGYVKTGSTWLQKHMLPNKSLGYKALVGRYEIQSKLFPQYELWYDPSIFRQELEKNSRSFDFDKFVPILSNERISGNAMSGGFDAIILADRLYEAIPDARILIVIREQRKMALSIYKQFVSEGGAISLKHFINQLPYAKVPWFDKQFLEFHHLIAYYQKLFGEDDVLVLPFEHFLRSKVEFCNAIARFSGGPLVTQVNEDKERPSFGGWVTVVRHRFNLLCFRDSVNPSAWFHFPRVAKAINMTERFFPPVIDHYFDKKMIRYINRELEGFYVESNRKTSEITGLDLGKLGYMV